MALNATIHKVELSLADMDTHRYENYALTVAQHPSETAERVMVRVLAYAMFAQEHLTFGRGLSTDEDADLQVLDLTGALHTAVLVGLPEEKLIRQFCGRASEVMIVSFGRARQEAWWRRNASALRQLAPLTVYRLAPEPTEALAELLRRSVRLSVSVQDGEYLCSSADGAVSIAPELLKAGG